MKTLFLLTNPIESPGERYRIYQYLPFFEALGTVCHVDRITSSPEYEALASGRSSGSRAPFVAGRVMRRLARLLRANEFDLIVSYRQPIGPWPGAVERLIARSGIPFVFDFDDAIFLPAPRPSNRFSASLRAPDQVARCVSQAALTTAGNEYLAEFARQYSERVTVLPTTVDTERYVPGEPRTGLSHVTIGWMGSRSTSEYLKVLDEVWGALPVRDRVALKVVGGTYETTHVAVENKTWRLETDAEDLRSFDIGLMPLPDNPWTRGKCGLKILQYMAMGIPVIASPVGVNSQIVENGVTGFLAASTSEWVDAIAQLVGDEELRHRMGAEGRRSVESRFSLQTWAPRFHEALVEASRGVRIGT